MSLLNTSSRSSSDDFCDEDVYSESVDDVDSSLRCASDSLETSDGISSRADTYKLSSVFSNSLEMRRDAFLSETSAAGFEFTAVAITFGEGRRSHNGAFLLPFVWKFPAARVRELTGQLMLSLNSRQTRWR